MEAENVSLARRLHRAGNPTVLILGDLITDIDIEADLGRACPEAPGQPIYVERRRLKRDGGAGAVRAMVEAFGADTRFIYGNPRCVKTRFWVDGQLAWRSDWQDIPGGHDANAERIIVEQVDEVDAVLIADYGKGTCCQSILNTAIVEASVHGIPCIVDPARGQDWSAYTGATALKCNNAQANEAVRHGPSCQAIYTFKHSVVTHGAEGLTYLRHRGDSRVLEITGRPRQVIDVTGAGDMVLAAMGFCIADGMTWPEAAKVAVAASGLKIERRGAVPVSRAEVIADLLHGNKIIDPELLGAVAEAARAAGKRVVFTNGCFDLLHRGHVHCLQAARAEGDIVIVGINSDRSTREAKGPGRPLQPAAVRSTMVAALGCVDWVAEFDAPTPVELVRDVRPDVLVKGNDWEGAPIAGKELLPQWGGRLHLVPRLAGYSTTASARSL